MLPPPPIKPNEIPIKTEARYPKISMFSTLCCKIEDIGKGVPLLLLQKDFYTVFF